ncbi:MAG: DNA/RNA nuclease SfsA [Chloroflexota bacterium]|nr:DNA/RNA nuclease SfsA [Chloroflexota bacterium]
MKLNPDLQEGHFISRLNRFVALVEVAGREELVHVANSGRLRELFEPGRRLLLAPAPGEHRKTRYDLALVDLGHTLVSADARLPNALVAEALRERALEPYADYLDVRREVTFGESRLDLMLEGPPGRCYLETKSVTLVEDDGMALFPDAPTIRGVKHLHTLTQAVAMGHRAGALFVIQRGDARSLKPHDSSDPEFGKALREARSAGVDIFAYSCAVTPRDIRLAHPIPVIL